MSLQLENAGSGSRDFIFVDDIAKGLMACAAKGQPGDVYNLASGRETTIRELAELIMKITGSQSKLEILPKRDWDTSIKRFGSTAKAQEKIGFEAVIQIEEGLRRTVEWTTENLPLIESCILKHQDKLMV